ncbi:MAG: DegV family protein [Acidimicrobiales bacterium]
MAVAVVTDSAAAIPAKLARRLKIVVAPMRLTIGDHSYNEDQIPLDEVVRRFDEGIHTAGPSPGDLQGILVTADRGDGVVVLTVSERMSSTYKSALLASELSGCSAAVIDTRSAAGGQSLVVMAAARAARAGQDLASVVASAAQVRDAVRMVATVETLDYLVRGGRLPEPAGRAGRYLGVRPIFELRGDGIKALRPALSRDRALEALLGHWRRSRPAGDAALHLAVSHALDPGAAEFLVDGVRGNLEPATTLVESFSPVMVAHTGPGVVGLAWYWEPAGEAGAGGAGDGGAVDGGAGGR